MNLLLNVYQLNNDDVIATSGLSVTPLCGTVDAGDSYMYAANGNGLTNDGTYYFFRDKANRVNGAEGTYDNTVDVFKAEISCAKVFDSNGKQVSSPTIGTWYHIDSNGDLHVCTNDIHHGAFPS